MANKPIVKYSGTVTIDNHTYLSNVANITEVKDHPTLGDQPWVRTSSVLSYDEETGRVETLNTIYERE